MTDPPPSLASAMALLQTRLPHIAKSAEAQYGKYADLAAITSKIMPELGACGLSFITRPTFTEDGTRFVLRYLLLHTSGQSLYGDYPLPTTGTPQQIGSAITYARRYCLCAVTGVAADQDDDDGQAAETAARSVPAAARKPRGKPPERAPGNLPRNADGSLSRSQITDPELAAAGAMTDAQLRDHNRLERDVKGTDAHGKSAPATERLNGTPADDPYLAPPAVRAPKAAGNPRAVIMQHFARLGFKEPDHRDARLEAISLITGRHVESVNALTAGEGARLIAELGKMRDRDALEELLTELAGATADA